MFFLIFEKKTVKVKKERKKQKDKKENKENKMMEFNADINEYVYSPRN